MNSRVFAHCAVRFAQHRLLSLCIYFLASLKMFQARGRPKTLTNRDLAKQLKLLTMQRHPRNYDGCSLCWERDPVPASVFGRVCLTSCQINIYSQIYLFAFVIENSCGLFCVCVRCFVPLVYFWLHSAGERGCHSLSWLQPFQLPLLTHAFEPLLEGGTCLAALLCLGTASSPLPPRALVLG